MSIPFVLLALGAAALGALAPLLLGRPRRLPDAGDAGRPIAAASSRPHWAGARADAPVLSIIVPARNEARRIGALLASLPAARAALLAQAGVASELIVVDDESTDATAELAARAGAAVLRPSPRPDGWAGKSWACWNGALSANGALLLFLDADVRLEASALVRVVTALETSPGVLSVQPYHRAPTARERLSAVANLVVMAATGSFAVFGDRAYGAFGPCIACTSVDYRRFGGHAAVRESVLDDVELARAAARAGIAVTNFEGRGALEFRMYPEGMGSMFEGWSKNLASGALAPPAWLLALIAAWLLGGIGIVALAGALVLTPQLAPSWAALLGAWAAYALMLRPPLARIGSFGPLTALLFPLPLAFFLAAFSASAVKSFLLRRVTWKGRSLPLHSSRSITRS